MSKAGKTVGRGLLGLLVLAAVLWLVRPAQVWAHLRQADPFWLLLGLLAAIGSNLVSAQRWRILVRWLGADVGVLDATRWYFQAIGLNTLLPGAVLGGDVYRVVVLRRDGAALSAASLSVLLDRVSGLWMLCVIGGVGALLCASELAPMLGWTTSMFAVAMIAVTSLWFALPYGFPRLPPARLRSVQAIFRRPDYFRQLNAQVVLSAAVQLLSAAALAAGALAFGVNRSAVVWLFASMPIFLMAALPVSVGGWGTREAATVAALAPFAVAAPVAVSIGLVYGGYALVQGALGALAFGLPRERS